MAKRKSEAVWFEDRQRWQINVQTDGKRKTFTSSIKGKRGKADAERKADRWLEEPTTAEVARVSKLLDEFEAHLKSTKSTGHANQYCGFIRLYIRPVIGLKKINKLTEGDLQDVIDIAYSKNKLADKTLRDIRGCIMSWLKWCRQHGKTRLFPEGLTIPAGAKKPEKKIVHPSGLTTLFNVTTTIYRGKCIEDWNIHAYRFEVLTGLRPGELRGIEDRRDLRGNKLTIRQSINVRNEITQGKNNNARRTIQLSAMAMAEVEAQRAMVKKAGILSPHLFPSADGGCLNHKNYYRAWGRYCEANGIPKTSLYELRHTFISVNKEMPAGLKKMVVGHSKDMDTEGVYGHEMAGDMAKAADYTEQAFAAVVGKK